jgi:hypothetical protein
MSLYCSLLWNLPTVHDTLHSSLCTFSGPNHPEIRLCVTCISAPSASHLAFTPDILEILLKHCIVKQSQKSS